MAETVLDASALLALVNNEPGAALVAAALRPLTRSAGLSLGDRACRALADREGVPALTTDRAWAKLRLPIEIRLIR